MNSRNSLIEAFKRRTVDDPEYYEKKWMILEHAIHEIQNDNASCLNFEQLNRIAYDLVARKFGDKLYSGLVSTMRSNLKEIAASIEASQGDLFLEVDEKWREYKKTLKSIRAIFMYMEENFIPVTHKTPILNLGLNLWRDNIVHIVKIQKTLKDRLLELVQKERRGEVIDRSIMRNVVAMLMELGCSVYQEYFEKPFLVVSADFYQGESQLFNDISACGDYLKIAEKRLNEEIERVSHYLVVETEVKIINVVTKEMIERQMDRLVHMDSGLANMLVSDKYDDLGRMYRLFSRVPKGLSLVSDLMASHIQETGKELVTDPKRLEDPVNLVQRLLDEKDKYDKIIHLSFNGDLSFQAMLDLSFKYLIDLNTQSPRFISLFIDDTLRKVSKGVEEVDAEIILNKVMTLVCQLSERDVFEKHYIEHFADRILSNPSISEDIERTSIAKLITEFGRSSFTSKLELMLADLKTETMKSFYKAMGDNLSGCPTLSAHVLRKNIWPIQQQTTCNLPPDIQKVCAEFNTYYLGTNANRVLTWQTNMGLAHIKATFSEGQEHELSVSTHQMCVLTLFNDADSLSYKEIQKATALPSWDLKLCLKSLACVEGQKVLRKEPNSKEIGKKDTFFFNEKFSSESYVVNIRTLVQKNPKTKISEMDKKDCLDAAIVRILKARKVLGFNNIVAEVTEQVKKRFSLKPSLIKKRIEVLIERGFIERDKYDRKVFRYLHKHED